MLEVVPDHITAPDGIELRQSEVDKTLVGAWCLKPMSAGSILGPFVGEIVYEHNEKSVDYRFAWEVYNLDTSELLHILNATDPNKGNWMRYVNCARYLEEQNLVSVQDGKEVFYKAIKDIKSGQELLTWFEPFKKKRKPRKPKNSINESKDSAFSDTSSVVETDSGKPKRNRKKKKMFDDDIFISDFPKKKKKNERKLKEEITDAGEEKVKKVAKKQEKKKINQKGISEDIIQDEDNLKQKGGNSKPKGGNLKSREDNTLGKNQTDKGETKTKIKYKKMTKSEKKSLSEIEVSNKKTEKMKSNNCEEDNSVDIVEENWTYPSKDLEYQFDLQSHFAITSNGRRMYKCDICSGIYRHTFSLKRHYLRNHINSRYLSQMDIGNCMISVSQQHLPIVSSNDPKMLKKIDQFLNMTSDERASVKVENKPSKSIVMPGLYRCHDCYKLFDYVEDLITHTQDHPPVQHEKQFACDKCHMRFPYKQNLVRHKLVHEGETKTSKKEVKAEKKEKLELAVPLTPTGKPAGKPFACQNCNMRFKYIVNLKKHEPVHSADRPFVCSSCGKAFPTATNLKKHVHIAHVGSKVPCKFCSTVFNHVGRLRKHIRVEHPEIHRQRLLKLLDKRGKLSPKAAQRLEETYKNVKGKAKSSCNVKAKQPKVTEKVEDKEDKEFQYACVLCKKRFNSYINMCRHRRMAHKNEKKVTNEEVPKTVEVSEKIEQVPETKPEETCLPEISDEPIDNSPEAIAEFYANVANNIADNLNFYIDGGESSLTKFRDHIKIENYESVLEVKPGENSDTDFRLDRFNFPSNYDTTILENNFVSFNDTKFPSEKNNVTESANDMILFNDRPPGLCTRRRSSRDESVTPDNSRDADSSNSRDGYSSNSRDSCSNVESCERFKDRVMNEKSDVMGIGKLKNTMLVTSEKDNSGNEEKNYETDEKNQHAKASITDKQIKCEKNMDDHSFEENRETKAAHVEDPKIKCKDGHTCEKSTEGEAVASVDKEQMKYDKKRDKHCGESTEAKAITSFDDKQAHCEKMIIKDDKEGSRNSCKSENSETDFKFHTEDPGNSTEKLEISSGKVLAPSTKSVEPVCNDSDGCSHEVTQSNLIPRQHYESFIDGMSKDEKDLVQNKIVSDSENTLGTVYNNIDSEICEKSLYNGFLGLQCDLESADSAEEGTGKEQEDDTKFISKSVMMENETIDISHSQDCNITGHQNCFCKENNLTVQTDFKKSDSDKIGEVKNYDDDRMSEENRQPISEQASIEICSEMIKDNVNKSKNHGHEDTFVDRGVEISIITSNQIANEIKIESNMDNDIREIEVDQLMVGKEGEMKDEREYKASEKGNIQFSGEEVICNDKNLLSGSTVVINDVIIPKSQSIEVQSIIDQSYSVNDNLENDVDSDGGSSGILLMNLSSDSGLDSDDPDMTNPVLKGLELAKSPAKNYIGNSNLDILSTVCAMKSDEMRKNANLPLINSEKCDKPGHSPQHSYDTIAFGKHGQVSYVCSVCIKHFRDQDLLLRHQIKKHPSIYCHSLEVEQGHEIEYLYYAEPCNVGVLGMTGKALESVVDKSNYTCTRCYSTFKNVDRLRVHIINCAPKTAAPEPEEKPKRKYKKKLKKAESFETEALKVNERADDSVIFKETSADNSGNKFNKLKVKRRRFMGCRKRKVVSIPDTPECSPIKITNSNKKRGKSIDLRYNPGNHVRRRELTEVLDKHQCNGCGVKFKTISLLERHIKKCDRKERFKDLKVMKSQVNETFHRKVKHTCLYCSKGFTYPKTLMNHYKAFCLVKKDKVSKGCLSDEERREEMLMMVRLKQQDEDRSLSKSVEFETERTSMKKGGWPRGVKRKLKRKGHCWTTIKKRKVSTEDEVDKSKVTATSNGEDRIQNEESGNKSESSDENTEVTEDKIRFVQSVQNENAMLVTLKPVTANQNSGECKSGKKKSIVKKHLVESTKKSGNKNTVSPAKKFKEILATKKSPKKIKSNQKKSEVGTGDVKSKDSKSPTIKKIPIKSPKKQKLDIDQCNVSNSSKESENKSLKVKCFKKSDMKSVKFSDGNISVTVLNPNAKVVSPGKSKANSPKDGKVSDPESRSVLNAVSKSPNRPTQVLGQNVKSVKSPKSKASNSETASSISSNKTECYIYTKGQGQKQKSPKSVKKTTDDCVQGDDTNYQKGQGQLKNLSQACRNLQSVLSDAGIKTTPKQRKKSSDLDPKDDVRSKMKQTDNSATNFNSTGFKMEFVTVKSVKPASPSPKNSPKKISPKEPCNSNPQVSDKSTVAQMTKNKGQVKLIPCFGSCALLDGKKSGSTTVNKMLYSVIKTKNVVTKSPTKNKTEGTLESVECKQSITPKLKKEKIVNSQSNEHMAATMGSAAVALVGSVPHSQGTCLDMADSLMKGTKKVGICKKNGNAGEINQVSNKGNKAGTKKVKEEKLCVSEKKKTKVLKQIKCVGETCSQDIKSKNVNKSIDTLFTVPGVVSVVNKITKNKSLKKLKINTQSVEKVVPDSPQSDVSR